VKTKNFLLIFALMTCVARIASGHGTPIDVSVQNNHLVVLHTQDTRFAPPIFGQNDANDDFAEADFFPGLGNLILWDIPGYEIEVPNTSASLAIEVLGRPVIGSAGARRSIWYWNPETGLVEQSPADFHLLNAEGKALTLQPTNQQQLPPFLMAQMLVGETGTHNHSLLLYALDDDLSAPAGVYGFFAHLIYDGSMRSDPFLILFNYFSDNDLLDEAGLAIHAAGTLPGDFDLDDKVDGRDFLIWQRLYGSTTRTVADISLNGVVDAADLAIWQANYGAKFGTLSALNVSQVPEPSSLLLCLVTVSGMIGLKRQ
jgi:hypothetical protein